MRAVIDAYAQGAAAWANGPARVYGPLADALVGFSPAPLAGRTVLDLGSGTGVGSRAASNAGASVIACDIAHEMLLVDRTRRPPSAVANAVSMPFPTESFDVVLACFSLNHFDDPAPAVREAARVGHVVLASTYANDDNHPVKAAVDTAMSDVGWRLPEWYTRFRGAMTTWGTLEGATTAIEQSALTPIGVEHVTVPFFELGPEDLVAWRLGMAHIAPHYASLDSTTRALVRARALELLGPTPEPLIRRVIFLAATADPAAR